MSGYTRYVRPGDEPDWDVADGDRAGNFYGVTAVTGENPFVAVEVGCIYDRNQESGYFSATEARSLAIALIEAAKEIENDHS